MPTPVCQRVNRCALGGYVLPVSDPRIWWQETRRCGVAAAGAPVLTGVGVLALAVVLRGGGVAVGTGMVRLSATLFPLACGLGAASALGRERLVELQVSVVTPYALTVARRLTVITALSAGSAVVMLAGLHGAGLWRHPAGGAAGLLVPMGPALFLIGVAAWASAALRLHAAPAAAVVVAAWVFDVFIWSSYVAQWQVNTTLLLIAGVLAAVGALLLFGDAERLVAAGAR